MRRCGPLSLLICVRMWNVNSPEAEIIPVLFSAVAPASRGVSVAELALNKQLLHSEMKDSVGPPAGPWGPHALGLSERLSDAPPPPRPRQQQRAGDTPLSILAPLQGCHSNPRGVGRWAAAQLLHLTPLPLGSLDIAVLRPSVLKVGTMTRAHTSGGSAS